MTASALVAADAALERGEVPTVPHAGSPVLVAWGDRKIERYVVVRPFPLWFEISNLPATAQDWRAWPWQWHDSPGAAWWGGASP